MKSRSILLLGILLILGFNWACQKKKPHQKKSTVKPAVREIVVLSADDSTKGISKGWTLSSQGMVIYWRKNLGNALFDEVPIKADSNKVRAIIDSLKQTGILQQKLHASANKIYHLRYKQGGEVIHLSWKAGTPLPAAFLAWRAKTLQWCRELKQQKQTAKH